MGREGREGEREGEGERDRQTDKDSESETVLLSVAHSSIMSYSYHLAH